jgi:CRP-like cAMP-binding protein
MLNYEALEDSCLFVLDRKHFTELLDRNACWQIIKNSILEKFFIQKSNRESQLLSKDAETRYQQFLMDFPNLEHRLKNYHIASYLGISPETLSRIRTKNKIYVVNKRARSS